MPDLVEQLLGLLADAAAAGRQRPLNVLIAECERFGADPALMLRLLWRRLRLQVQVQRAHVEMLEEYCKAHSREAAPVRR
jgi:hypothetical protein